MSQRYNSNPFGPIISLLMVALVIAGIYYVIKGVFWVLAWVFPLLIIATLIIDRQVIIDYVMWIVNSVKNKKWTVFIGATLLTIFAFPFVAAFLFGKAMLKRKVKQVRQQYNPNAPTREEGDFVEFEEMPTEEPEILELPDLTQRQERRKEPIRRQEPDNKNDYEQLFD